MKRILFEDEARREVAIVKIEVGQTPVVGFYTYGEQNMSDDNVLTYYNESASVLVFGNELNDVARVNHENERLYAQLQATIVDLERANEETKRKAEELARFNRLMVGREVRMAELKEEIRRLKAQLGKLPEEDSD